MKGDREKCLEVGMDEYVAKPIRIGVLKEKLRMVLAPLITEGSEDEVAESGEEVAESGDVAEIASVNSAESTADESTADESTTAESTADQKHEVQQAEKASSEADVAIDLNRVRNMVGGDEELLRELLTMYLGESETLLAQIATGIESGDGKQIRRAGHTLSGASRSVGAANTSNVANALQAIQDDGPFEPAQDCLDELRRSVADVTITINEFLGDQA
jgi:two-component system sensor histidine kinase/response regulator